MVSAVRKKSLGQHFLTNPETARRIAGFLIRPTTHIVEIGPGAGILTEALLQHVSQLIVVEKDESLLPQLRERFGERLDVRTGDALEILPGVLGAVQPVSVVSNLPYNISSPITFLLCQAVDHVQEMVLMYQKEVADRIRKEPGPLHLACTAFFHVTEKMKLKPASFSPPPKVDSAVLHFERRESFTVQPDPRFFRFCRAIFENRRKMLARNLKRFGAVTDGIMDRLGLDARVRVDQLTNSQLIEIYKEFEENEIQL